jgi:hypothetical protein
MWARKGAYEPFDISCFLVEFFSSFFVALMLNKEIFKG